MKRTALILALAIALPAWAQDKPADQRADKPAAAQDASQAPEKAEPAKPAGAEPEAKAEPHKKAARKHSSKRMEDARHCLDEPSNTAIIKCAEAYL